MERDLSRAVSDESLVAALKASDDYCEYEEAFIAATGLPLALTPASHLTLALCSKHQSKTSFCALMTQSGSSCETCRALHRGIEREMGLGDEDAVEMEAAEGTVFTEKSPESVGQLSDTFGEDPRTFECFAGLCETMVPVKAGNRLVAFLKTGQVMAKRPTTVAFRKAMGRLNAIDDMANIEKLEKAFFATPVLPPERYKAMTTLLKTYAKHLSEASQKMLLKIEHNEPEGIKRAKLYMGSHFESPIGLEETAQSASMSPFHFSKRFKETVGMGFQEYLTRLRLEKSKELLWEPNKRIAEAAFESGFQSMATFNRAWRKYQNDSPKEYRKRHVSA